ncbi:MAG: hypothetical protein ABJA98_02310 [Acidobacteriota bacterium]
MNRTPDLQVAARFDGVLPEQLRNESLDGVGREDGGFVERGHHAAASAMVIASC